MATASYEKVMMLGTAVLADPGKGKVTGDAREKEIIGQMSNWQPPEFAQNTLEYVTRFGSNPIYLHLNPLTGLINLQGYLPDMNNFFLPFFGADITATDALPRLTVLTPLLTDAGIGHSGELLVETCGGAMLGRAPQARTPQAFGTINYTMRIEEYIAHRESFTLQADGSWVKNTDLVQEAIGPDTIPEGADLRAARYSNLAKAPDTYYNSVKGHWFENGVNIYSARFLGTSLQALRGG